MARRGRNGPARQRGGYQSDDQERLGLEREGGGIFCAHPELAPLVPHAGNRSLPGLRLYRYKGVFSVDFEAYGRLGVPESVLASVPVWQPR
jgi:hypothetical protein